MIPTARFVPSKAATIAPDEPPSLCELLEARRVKEFVVSAAGQPGAILELLKDAGGAGVIAYFIAFVIFYSIASAVGEVVYHTVSGQWVDPRMLLLADKSSGKAETAALLASF